MNVYVFFATLIFGLVFISVGISKLTYELRELRENNDLIAGIKKWLKVPIFDYEIAINHHISSEFSQFETELQDLILSYGGCYVNFSYKVGGKNYTSQTPFLVPNEDAREDIEDWYDSAQKSKSKPVCYVSKENNRIACLVKPDKKFFKRMKWSVAISNCKMILLGLGIIGAGTYYMFQG